MSGSILAEPEACFVMMIALPFGSTRAIGHCPHHQAPTVVRVPTCSLRTQGVAGKNERDAQ
jgi:hypothetical protein